MAGIVPPAAAWHGRPQRWLAPVTTRDTFVRRIGRTLDTGSNSALGRVRWLFLLFVLLAALLDAAAGLADARRNPDLLALGATAVFAGSVLLRHLERRPSRVSWSAQFIGLAVLMRMPHTLTPMALLYLCVLLNAAYATKRRTLHLIGAYTVLVAIHWWYSDWQLTPLLGTVGLVAVLHVGLQSLAQNLRSFDAMRERRTALAEATTAMAAAVTEEDVKQTFVAGMAWLLEEASFISVHLHWSGGDVGATIGAGWHGDAIPTQATAHIPLLDDDHDTAVDITGLHPFEESVLTDVRALGMAAVLRLTAIAESERFRRLVERSSDRITVASPDLIIAFHGGAGPGADDDIVQPQVGQSLQDVVHPEDFAALVAALDSLLPGRANTMNLRFRGDRGWRHTETVIGNELDEPSVRGYVLNTRDVTDRLRLENELRHAQKLEAVGRLAAGIAHEINTPIQFIGDNLRFLADAFRALDSVEDDDAVVARDVDDLAFYRAEVPGAIGDTIAGIERVATIVGAMRAFGHLDQAHPTAVDIVAALHNTVIVARNETNDVADVVIEAADLPPVVGYAGDLNQVFLNLVVNAAHAIAERSDGGRGTIRIRATRPTPDEVAIAFTDDGCGIPRHLQDKIFEPFFTTKDVGKGTGQGLALARGIVVDRHHGRLAVVSEPGEATTFTVVLPIEPPSPVGP
jgi:signal transduction histidine kinase